MAKPIKRKSPRSSPPHERDSISKNEGPDALSEHHLPEREIDFVELEDGTLVEMIEDPADSTRPLLAVYKNRTVRYTDRLRVGNTVFVPLSRTDLLSKHICLPRGAESYVGLRDLIRYVGAFLNACLDVEFASLWLVIAHVFCSWFPEKLSFAPYLALVGPPGSGKTTALRILSLLCRRSLPTSDITSAAFYDVCHRMHPTILIDETRTAGDPRTLLHLLRSSSSRGFVALRKDKAQMAYGPKVLAWLELPNDAALNSRCVIIPMRKTARTDLNGPDDPIILGHAAKVRMRLLQFRFEHYRSLSVPKIPADVQLSSRPLDLYRALALPFGEYQEFCDELARLIVAQREFQPSSLSPQQASAVRVLSGFIHMCAIPPCYPLSAMTARINSDLASRGEPAGLHERKIGDVLTSLGLTNRSRMHPGGYVLWMDRSTRVRIHELARDYEVDGISTDPMPGCEICMNTDAASPTSRTPEAANEKQVRSDGSKRELREHRERGKRRTAPP